jgi:hypothetical protein
MTDHSHPTNARTDPENDAPRSAPAPRPRPQFGELATPDEQRAAIAVPPDVAAPESVPVAETPKRQAAPQSLADQTSTADGMVKAPADRFVSWALLGLGLFNILTTSAALIDLPGAIDQFFAADDLDPYGPVTIGRALGIGALVVTVLLWILALVLVQRRVNAGKISWWIPVVAGVVASIVVLVCVGGAMMIDPSVFDYIQRMSGATT